MVESSTPKIAFLGVSTGSSWVHRVFSRWAACLQYDLALESMDLALRSPASSYRHFVMGLRERRGDICGALITSHKAAVFETARDLFDELTPESQRLGEVGMVYWRDDRIVGAANDSISTRAVVRRLLLDSPRWANSARKAVILGAGGAGLALVDSLVRDPDVKCSDICVTECDGSRLLQVRSRIADWIAGIPINILHVNGTADDVVAQAGEGALIVNATGLGKDLPGSPVSPQTVFPNEAFVWEFNYRLIPQQEPSFLETARRQAHARKLTIEDGWEYFIWGWLCVMANALGRSPADFHDCFKAAAEAARGAEWGSVRPRMHGTAP